MSNIIRTDEYSTSEIDRDSEFELGEIELGSEVYYFDPDDNPYDSFAWVRFTVHCLAFGKEQRVLIWSADLQTWLVVDISHLCLCTDV